MSMFLNYLAEIFVILLIIGIFMPFIIIVSKNKNKNWIVLSLISFILLPFAIMFKDNCFEAQYGYPDRMPQHQDVEEGTAEYAYGYLVFEGDTVKIQKIYWKNQRELFTKYSKHITLNGDIDYTK